METGWGANIAAPEGLSRLFGKNSRALNALIEDLSGWMISSAEIWWARRGPRPRPHSTRWRFLADRGIRRPKKNIEAANR